MIATSQADEHSVTDAGLDCSCKATRFLQVKQEDVLALAAAIEVGSEHPIASAIVNRAQALLAPEMLFGGGQTPKQRAATPKAGGSLPGSPVACGKARQLDWVWTALEAGVVHGALLLRALVNYIY